MSRDHRPVYNGNTYCCNGQEVRLYWRIFNPCDQHSIETSGSLDGMLHGELMRLYIYPAYREMYIPDRDFGGKEAVLSKKTTLVSSIVSSNFRRYCRDLRLIFVATDHRDLCCWIRWTLSRLMWLTNYIQVHSRTRLTIFTMSLCLHRFTLFICSVKLYKSVCSVKAFPKTRAIN